MNPKLKTLILGVIIITLIAISGCVEEPRQDDKLVNISSSTPFFPVQTKPSEVSMTALLEGELVFEAGCLRMKYGHDNFLLVWPYGFSVSTDKYGVITIIDIHGQPIMKVGDKVKLGGGGGEIPDEHIAQYSADLPSVRCSGPYWIVGEVITSD